MTTEILINFSVIGYSIISLFLIERIFFRKAIATRKVISYANRKGLEWEKGNVAETMMRGRKVWKSLFVSFSGFILLCILVFVIPRLTFPFSGINAIFFLITSIGLIAYGIVKSLRISAEDVGGAFYSLVLAVFFFSGMLWFLIDTDKKSERDFFFVYLYFIGLTILLVDRYFKKYKYR